MSLAGALRNWTMRAQLMQVWFGIAAAGLTACVTGAAQEQTPAVHLTASGITRLSSVPGEFAVSSGPRDRAAAGSEGIRRITLEQVKHSLNPVASPVARLGQLSVEAAREHRLGVEADYFPKLGASFLNLHYTDFLGQVITIRRPLLGTVVQAPVPLLSQNQTIAFMTLTQPVTPLLAVHQAVRIARADELIAKAKAGVAVAQNERETKMEETYFRLLIAQRQLTSAEAKVRALENPPLHAGDAIESVRAPAPAPELAQAKAALAAATAKVKELTASLNRSMGWPEDTKLDLVIPDPLVESISLEDVANQPVFANPDVIEAEQNVVKARAAEAISKLAYVPTVAAVGGYMFQNAIPAVNSNFGFGGVIASYNLFDFGKREAAVKESRARLGMAQIALQLAKTKVAAEVKKAYSDLERSRQISNVAQRMGSSVVLLVNSGSNPEGGEAKAARAEVELEILEADLAHRQAYARLLHLLGSQAH
jgi:outer membrane protein TolC